MSPCMRAHLNHVKVQRPKKCLQKEGRRDDCCHSLARCRFYICQRGKKYFGDVTKLCGGHYTRAHYQQLKKLKQQKSFGPVQQSKYKEVFPEVKHAHCKCRIHKARCRCFTNDFFSISKRNYSMPL